MRHLVYVLRLAAAAGLTLAALGGCGRAPEPAAANVSDTEITEHVKTVLHQAPSLSGADIAVVTLKGDVRLIGVLDTQAQIDEALRIARAAEGSHSIHDELTLKP